MTMRKLQIKVTSTIEVTVPDDFPADAAYVQHIIDWKSNDYCDGRFPFDSEQVMVGAVGAVRYGVQETVFQKVCQMPEFDKVRTKDGLHARDVFIHRITKPITCWADHGGRLDIEVTEVPKAEPEQELYE
jgi:hypothetical protein